MMANSSGRGNKRDLDSQLNLTPFIDLLSTCICFLLISAVWVEIGALDIKQSHGTSGVTKSKDAFDLEIAFNGPSQLTLELKKNGKGVKTLQVEADSPTGLLDKLDRLFKEQLKTEIATATVATHQAVNYGQLVSTLDVLRKNHLVNIGVVSKKGGK